MEISKEQIIELLKNQGDEGTAEQARNELPEKLDTERDAGLLEKYGINIQDIVGGAGGLGGLL
jgi:hypothetical protein